MKHKNNRQTPASIYPTHKQKNNQADNIHAASEIPEKVEHPTLSGKSLINGISELVIQDRNDNIGQQRNQDEDFYKGGFLHEG